MGKHKEKNNVIKYSQTRQNNELFKEQVNQNRFKEEDLLGETRAITFLEKTQLLQKVDDKPKEEIVLPKLKKEVKESKRMVLALLILLLVGISLFTGFMLLRNKFKDITIEVGTKEVSAKDFLVSKIYKKK